MTGRPGRMRKNPEGLRKSSATGPLARMRKTVLIVLPIAAFAVTVYFVSSEMRAAFSLREIIFVGNTHFSEKELKELADLKTGENLLTLSGRKIYERLIQSPWIRSAMIRKELPHRLRIVIREAKPFALLDMRRHLFLVDDRGELLEELKNSPIPFLPVITGDPFRNKEVFLDAIELAKAIKTTGLLEEKDHIDIIANKAEDLSVNLDGELVKVGKGNYVDKLRRLMEVEGAIKKRGIPVEYIDLRFADRVVVKAADEVAR